MTGPSSFGIHARWQRLALAAVLPLLLVVVLPGCVSSSTTTTAGGVTRADDRTIIPRAEIDTEERRRARIRLELAANHYQSRNYATALDELRQALTIDPEYPAAYGMLGLVYMDLDDRPRAENSFKRALELSPGNPDINNNYGWFLCQTGRYREAIPMFEQAASDKLYNSPSKPLHNAGVCLRRAGDEAGAESYLQRAFKVDPRNAVAMFNLGEIYLGRRDYDKARFYAQRLVKSFEPAAQTLWLATKVEQASGNRDAFLSLGQQLRRQFPGSREATLLSEGKFND